MNHTYRLVWNDQAQRYVPAPETARSRGRGKARAACKPTARLGVAATLAFALPLFSVSAFAQAAGALAANALPTGAQVVAGQAGIAQSGSQMTVTQGSDRAIINWQSFNIGSNAAVQFIQPSTSAVALNRVIAGDASQIQGKLTANGQVWLINPNGVVFGKGSQVDVGGLVASTLNITDADFLAGKAVFSRNGATGGVLNQGTITAADGGLVALLAPTVSNEGIITARLGSVAMAAGDRITLDSGANGLLQVAVDPATVKTLVENRQLIVADGGQVVMTGKAADALSASVVANTGTIQAHTIAEREGRILLLADMEHGEVQHSGLLDASAPNGGNGGFVETSAAKVTLAAGRKVTTLAARGKSGTWLIDPTDFTIGLTSGDITGRQLSADLNLGNVIIQSTNGNQAGFGDINVNAPVSWSADTTLTLQAQRYININADLTATGTNAGLVLGSAIPGTTYPVLGHGARISLSGSNASLKIGQAGTEQSYRLIHSLDELQAIAATPNGNYALAVDIDASATAGWNGGAGFNPIGTTSNTIYGSTANAFIGNFNGLGHTITNLTINRPGQRAVGLFGAVGGGRLSDFGLLDAKVTGGIANSADLYGIGAVAGYIYRTEINGVYSENGTVSGSQYNAIGGLVGVMNSSSIFNSYSTGSITATSPSMLTIGGLVGAAYNRASIINSYTKSNILISDADLSSCFGALLGFSGDPLGGSGTGAYSNFVGNYAWNFYDTRSSVISRGVIGDLDSDIPTPGNYYRSDWLTSSSGSAVGTITSNQILSSPGQTNLNFTDTWSLPAGAFLPVLQKFQRDVFVFANDINKTYDGQASAPPSATIQGASTTGTLSYSGSYQGAVNAGTYAITPTGLSLPTSAGVPESFQHYGTIYYVPGTLTIAKAPLTVAANGASKTYDGLAWSGNSGVSYSGFVNGEGVGALSGSLSYGGSAQGASNAGSYAITPGGLNSNNYAITFVDGALTISPRAITVKANDLSRYYGDANPGNGGLSLISGSLVGSDALGNGSLASTATAGSNAGQSYGLTPSNAAFTSGSAGNYSVTYVDGTLTITPRPITLKPDDLTRAYGSANPGSALFVISTGSLANGDTLQAASVSSAATASANAGESYALTAGSAAFTSGSASNYLIAYQNGTLTITKAPLAITANNGSKTYDGLAWSGGNGVNYSGFVNGEGAGALSGSLVYGGSAQGARNAGTYALTAGGLSSGNYAITFVDGSVNIAKAPLAITANNGSKTYDGLTWSGGNGVSYSGFVNGEGAGALSGSLVYGGSAQGERNAGTYTLTPGGLSSGNYAITFVDGHLTVTPAALTVTTNAVTKTYDGTTAANGTAIISGGQLFGSDTLSGGTFAFTDKNAGSGKTVAVSGVSVNDGNGGNNYAVTYADNTASTINKAALTVTTGAVTKTYDGTTIANGTAIATGGTQLFGSDTLSGGTFAFTDKNAGSDKTVAVSGVSVNDGNGGNNYAVTYANNTASTINKAALSVIANNVSKTYDGSAFNGGAGVSYRGFAAGEDASVLSGTLAYSGNSQGAAEKGSYTITPSGLAGSNYAITFVNGTLSIASPIQMPSSGEIWRTKQHQIAPLQHQGIVALSGPTAAPLLVLAPSFIRISPDEE